MVAGRLKLVSHTCIRPGELQWTARNLNNGLGRRLVALYIPDDVEQEGNLLEMANECGVGQVYFYRNFLVRLRRWLSFWKMKLEVDSSSAYIGSYPMPGRGTIALRG